ncbi:SGNH/GDSL hydrolase family protein [Naumannella sp. ID2617S]|nr:SGNH/GDSL hydrolase family protein [Naumannella sp. ID2617S]
MLGVSLWLGGTVGVLLVGHLGGRELLRRQAAAARRLIGDPFGEDAPAADKIYKKKFPGRIELLVVGDSIAAGLGADRPKDTFGARLAKGVAKKTETAVRLRTVAVVGAESSMLDEQLDVLESGYRPDVAVVIVGGNDVTHRVPVSVSVRHLGEAVDRLHGLGGRVVVGTCPDLGTLRPVPQPLRTLGRRRSRQLARAQRRVVLEKGARAVSLSRVVGPFFISNPDEMFSLDRFHPSSAGYRRTAKAIMPSVLAALGVTQEVPLGHFEPVLAAAAAVEEAGEELADAVGQAVDKS